MEIAEEEDEEQLTQHSDTVHRQSVAEAAEALASLDQLPREAGRKRNRSAEPLHTLERTLTQCSTDTAATATATASAEGALWLDALNTVVVA